jgi:flagellum-specific peptidoglycan hydrolase FlgJ
MGDPIRSVPGTASVAGSAATEPVTTTAAAVIKAAVAKQVIHQIPVLAPVDALQTAFPRATKAVPETALFADTVLGQATDYQDLTIAELQKLGAQKDKTAFFQALLPGALQSEKDFGVPASVILAQAALESGWGKHAIGGFNLFGIKGEGPAGTRLAWTHEQMGGKSVRVQRHFAQFHTIAEAVSEHGKVFHNGSYDKALAVFRQTADPARFIDAMASKYATSKTYGPLLKGMLKSYGLTAMAQAQGGH